MTTKNHESVTLAELLDEYCKESQAFGLDSGAACDTMDRLRALIDARIKIALEALVVAQYELERITEIRLKRASDEATSLDVVLEGIAALSRKENPNAS